MLKWDLNFELMNDVDNLFLNNFILLFVKFELQFIPPRKKKDFN